MKSNLKKFGIVAIASCLLPIFSQNSYGWGLTGHKMVTDRAVRLLPTRIQKFYWTNRDTLAELCIQPDERKESDKSEGPKHYIDLEHYPVGPLPKICSDAIRQFGMGRLFKSGWVPWNTQTVYDQLVDAMRRHDQPAILRLSGDLSHYIADCHVPLHVTENYNGQMTGDKGVHARFESLLVDQFPEKFPFDPRPAVFVPDIPARLWSIIRESQKYSRWVLRADRRNRESDPDDGYSIVRARKNHARVAAHRMNAAAHEVASFWYSAWVTAGRPDLPEPEWRDK